MKLAPIILFVYNRPEHTKKTVEALKKNKFSKESILYIFSDGPKKKEHLKNVKKVRGYIKTIKGFQSIKIVERKKNFGLDPSVIDGVTNVINKHGKVVVLEDDVVTSRAFLTYMNFLLNKYEDVKKIYSVSGYNHPSNLMNIPKDYKYDIYFVPRAASWGWATWKDRWDKADWLLKDYDKFVKDKKRQQEFNSGGIDMTKMLIRSQSNDEKFGNPWDIRWCYTIFKNDGLCIYPTSSFVENIGHDGTGIHCGESKMFENINLNEKMRYELPDDIKQDEVLIKNFKKVYQGGKIKFLLSGGFYKKYFKRG